MRPGGHIRGNIDSGCGELAVHPVGLFIQAAGAVTYGNAVSADDNFQRFFVLQLVFYLG